MSQPFNRHWPRWIKASVNKHFSQITGTNFFSEGFKRSTEGLKDWIECRLDGPYFSELTKNCWKVEVEVNILVVVVQQADPYRVERILGDVTSLFLDCIDVRKHGENPNVDNGDWIGDLLIRPYNTRQKVVISNFGQVTPNIEQMQSSVEGHYLMTIG